MHISEAEKPQKVPDLSVGRSLRTSIEDLIKLIEEKKPTLVDSFHEGVLPVAAFDLDGTLWDADISYEVYRLAAERELFRPEIRGLIDQKLKLFGLGSNAQKTGDCGVNVDALRVLDAFLEWEKDNSNDHTSKVALTREMYAFQTLIYAGIKCSELESLVSELMQNGFRQKIFPQMSGLIETLAEMGIVSAVFSASPEVLVRAGVKSIGIPSNRAFGMRSVVDSSGLIRPRLYAPVMFHTGKRERLEAFLYEHAARIGFSDPRSRWSAPRALVAFGDSPQANDEELLMAAKISVVVNPKSSDQFSKIDSWIDCGRLVYTLSQVREQ